MKHLLSLLILHSVFLISTPADTLTVEGSLDIQGQIAVEGIEMKPLIIRGGVWRSDLRRKVYYDGSQVTFSANVSRVGRGLGILQIDRTTGDIISAINYDVHSSMSERQEFAADIHAIADESVIVCVVSDDFWRTTDGVREALLSVGASPSVLDTYKTPGRRSYALIGYKGIGAGNGYEAFGENYDAPPLAEISTFLMKIPDGGYFTVSGLEHNGLISNDHTVGGYTKITDLNSYGNNPTPWFKVSGGNNHLLQVYGTGDYAHHNQIIYLERAWDTAKVTVLARNEYRHKQFDIEYGKYLSSHDAELAIRLNPVNGSANHVSSLNIRSLSDPTQKIVLTEVSESDVTPYTKPKAGWVGRFGDDFYVPGNLDVNEDAAFFDKVLIEDDLSWGQIALETTVTSSEFQDIPDHPMIFTTRAKTDGNYPFAHFGNYGTLAIKGRKDAGNGGIAFLVGDGTDYLNAMTIERATGHVGVNNTNPTVPLEVNGDSKINGNANISGDTTIDGTTTINGSLILTNPAGDIPMFGE